MLLQKIYNYIYVCENYTLTFQLQNRQCQNDAPTTYVNISRAGQGGMECGMTSRRCSSST